VKSANKFSQRVRLYQQTQNEAISVAQNIFKGDSSAAGIFAQKHCIMAGPFYSLIKDKDYYYKMNFYYRLTIIIQSQH